ncbi:MAG: hypothetical protein KJ645_13085, partial [Planctomycetes bacterium]|nr:hypothetical protein [Planctomycetota bacterium]
EKGDYYRVLVPDGFQCYISAGYLEVDGQSMGTVTGSRVNLRSIPGVKGDYPIFQVDRGEKLEVWERIGDWYCVTAPVEAYLYIPKDAVTLLDSTESVQKEYATLSQQRQALWLSHRGLMQKQRVEREIMEKSDRIFNDLENAAAEGFKNLDLEEAARGYQGIVDTSEDENTIRLAKARLGEIEALKARKNTEIELARREAEWRKERENIEKAAKEAGKPVKPTPATHKLPGTGRLVTVIGTVDAHNAVITLRGGKTAVDTLYRIESPDGRYILGDFNQKRVSVLGRIGDLVSNDQPPIVVVERMEILN